MFCCEGRTANDGANAVRVHHPVLKYLAAQLEREGRLDPPNDGNVTLIVSLGLRDPDCVLERLVALLDDRLDKTQKRVRLGLSFELSYLLALTVQVSSKELLLVREVTRSES